MNKNLPARPNLDHLRRQAKTLLKQLEDGDAAAARLFAEHLPSARGKSPASRGGKLRLADAQSVVARQNGFASWPVLARHVDELRALEGEWRVASLEVEGSAMPPDAIAGARLLIDGDRFRMESPEASYEGIFTIDAEAAPAHIDIEFVSGPEAGNWSHGIYRLDGDAMLMCLGLTGAKRPTAFATRAGSGHALEQLRRASTARPANVTGGTPPAPPAAVERADAAAFEQATSPLLATLQGEWTAVELVKDGKALPKQLLAHATRTMTGNEVKVVVGGQTMVHAKVRIDDTTTPVAVDYLDLSPKTAGALTRGILERLADGDVRFLMAPAGEPRPSGFDAPQGTLSHWRKRA